MDSVDSRQLQKRVLAEAALLALLALVILFPFAKTLTEGASISKIGMIQELDAVQAPELRSPFWLKDDLSASMAHIPNELFAAKHEGNNELPLWNHLNGAGRPFVGEFQTLRFSFLHFMFPASSPYLYNLGIVAKVCFAGFGTFFLGRFMGLLRITSFTAAIAYAFCPHALRFVELCDNYFFYPYLLLTMLWLAANPSLRRVAVSALVMGLAAYNMHPETFACGTLFSAFAAWLAGFLPAKRNESTTEGAAGTSTVAAIEGEIKGDAICATAGDIICAEERNKGIRPAAAVYRCSMSTVWVLAVGLLSFMLAAPLVLSLVEFISNGESYKFADYTIEHIQSSAVFADLFIPGKPGSTYLGAVLGFTFLPGLIVLFRKKLELFWTYILVFLFTTRPGPLENILANPPLSFLLPEYSSYFMILLMAIIASFGLEYLFVEQDVRRISTALWAAALTGFFFLAGNSFAKDFVARIIDFNPAELNVATWFVPTSICVSILLLLTSYALKQWPSVIRKFKLPLLAAFAGINTIFLSALVPTELSPKEKFEFKENAIIRELQNCGARIIATGYNLFQTNTNLIYVIDDFRTTAPIYPRRYTHFQKLGGGGGRFFTIPDQSTTLSKVFDLAAVNYVLSDKMVTSQDDIGLKSLATITPQLGLPIKLAEGLRLEDCSYTYDATHNAVLAKSIFSVQKSAETHYDCGFALADYSGKPLVPIRWLSERIEEASVSLGQHRFEKSAYLPIPLTQMDKKIQICMYVRNNWTADMLNFAEHPFLMFGSVGGGTASNSAPAETGRFVRHKDLGHGLFLFKNKSSLPAAYLVHDVEQARDEETSLKLLEDPKIDFKKTAIVECTPTRLMSSNLRQVPADSVGKEQCIISKRSNDTISVDLAAVSPAVLIVTDTYFPGWEAYVDGKESTIYPANHMFRAVFVPAGNHKVEFFYRPKSFTWGTYLLISGLLLAGACIVLGSKRTKTDSSSTANSIASTQEEAQSEVKQST